MGSSVSQEVCRTQYNTTLQCGVGFDRITQKFFVKGLEPEEFEPNPDIAGDGVLYAFFVVSVLAVGLSFTYWFIQFVGQSSGIYGTTRPPRSPKQLGDSKTTYSKVSKRLAWLAVFEGVIMSCSDQQIFASGAYAITLQYAQQCNISTYHYNIIGSMLVMTCATHVSAAIVVPHHRREKGRFILVLRVILVILIFVVTGYTLTSQHMDTTNYYLWPNDVPAPAQNESLLLRPAACFGSNDTAVQDMLKENFETSEQFLKLMQTPTYRKFINGFNSYIVMSIIYALTLIVELTTYGKILIDKQCYPSSRYAQRRCEKKRVGLQDTTTDYKYKYAQIGYGTQLRYWAFRIWQVFGIAVCIGAVVESYLYIMGLKLWMNGSGWIGRDPITGENPEREGTSFGQLVPMLLTLLTLFTIVQSIEEKFRERHNQNKQDRRDIESYNATPKTESDF